MLYYVFYRLLQSWTKVVVTPTPSPRIQCCHVKSQFNIDLGGGGVTTFLSKIVYYIMFKDESVDIHLENSD